MSAPVAGGGVDVLAVMRRSADAAYEAGAYEGPESNESAYEVWLETVAARDAVAELIAAAKKAEAFISIAVPMLAVDRHEAVRDVLPNLRAALSNIEGGSK